MTLGLCCSKNWVSNPHCRLGSWGGGDGGGEPQGTGQALQQPVWVWLPSHSSPAAPAAGPSLVRGPHPVGAWLSSFVTFPAVFLVAGGKA